MNLSSTLNYVASALFLCAVVHTFFCYKINTFSHKYQHKPILFQSLHLLGEVEIVFAFWSFLLLSVISLTQGMQATLVYLNSLRFTEPVFVFVILCLCATKPILEASRLLLLFLAKLLPLPKRVSYYFSLLVFGPLIGSLATEPAAMTVVALLLKEEFYEKGMSVGFQYATLGLLFVNISLGGALTNFAAPPILMVSHPWGWNTPFVFEHFGMPAILSIIISTTITILWFQKEIRKETLTLKKNNETCPIWLIVAQLFLVFLCILEHSQIVFFLLVFFVTLALHSITKHLQDPLKVKESLLVTLFLGGLVILGGLQGWWLTPILTHLKPFPLMAGSTLLTSITDNAALTYLGTLVPNLSLLSQKALVSGAIIGGGLTVIANAPNPIGLGLLNNQFGEDGVSALKLLKSAFLPTLIAFFIYSLAIFLF